LEVIKVLLLVFVMSLLTMVDDPLAEFLYSLPIIEGLRKYTLIIIAYAAGIFLLVYWLVYYVFEL
jgi:hypothetical protein